ncbi:ketopantoate reductase [Nakamurella sp. UYEF19]|uniref:2-dehydropantoate 2-reductase N-terminal domain-containing protein n=1 Tax=Nakamurella sp. UYEF19 TaxID=1756392 RepID=UPI003397FF68
MTSVPDEQQMPDITAAVGDHTLVLPMLNGLQHVDRLVERFGRERVLGGVCVVSVTLEEQSR